MEKSALQTQATVITPEDLYEHWQGHRRLTRKMIEAFPEDKLFSYSIGGMRPFSALAMEMVMMAAPGIHGVVSGVWKEFGTLEQVKLNPEPKTKAELLEVWDGVTVEIEKYWPQIPPHRFMEKETAFGLYEGTIINHIFYFIDNEIHHRGQGYVYLRSLGLEPPPFYER